MEVGVGDGIHGGRGRCRAVHALLPRIAARPVPTVRRIVESDAPPTRDPSSMRPRTVMLALACGHRHPIPPG